jgi:hypothetical protein
MAASAHSATSNPEPKSGYHINMHRNQNIQGNMKIETKVQEALVL